MPTDLIGRVGYPAVWIAAPFLAEPIKRAGWRHVMEPMMDRDINGAQKRYRIRLHN